MKEATGELSMVVITLVAIVAILVLWNWMQPTITDWVASKFNWMVGSEQDPTCPTGYTYNTNTKSCQKNAG